jgi:hypothetical protein
VPFGSDASRPDYAYTSAPVFQVAALADGATARTVLRDASGAVTVVVEARREGDAVTGSVVSGGELLTEGWALSVLGAADAASASAVDARDLVVQLA